MKKILIFALPVLIIHSQARASEDSYKVSSQTSGGSGVFSEGISLSGDHPVDESDNPGAIDWNAGYSFARTPVGTGSNKTNSIDGSVGYKKDWDVGAGLSYSRTPDENLTAAGPNLWAGYVFELRGGTGEFQPNLEPRLSYRGQAYTQSFAGTTTTRVGSRRTITRPTTGSEQIHQDEFALSLEWSPMELLTARVSGSSYHYDKSVAHFIALLDSPRAVSTGAGTFANTLGGFPHNTAELGISLFPWETWTLDFSLSRAKVEADDSTSTSAKGEAAKKLTKNIKLGLGFEHDQSASQGVENLALFDFSYSF